MKAALGEQPDAAAPPPAKRLGRRPKVPEQLAYLWEWYGSLRRAQARGFEREPLSHQEIIAFRDLHGLQPPSWAEQRAPDFAWEDWPEHVMESFDVSVLRDVLDVAWMKAQSIKEEAPRPSGGKGEDS